MSTSATIPVFDPQGVLRDIPQDQLAAAVKSGGMPAVKFQTPEKNPDGTPKTRFVPANQYQEAYQHGGTVLSLQDQDIKHPGLWATLYDDAKEIGKSVLTAGPTSGSGDQISSDAAYQEKLIKEGHALPYRLLMSLTPDAMRESAESGDMGGVVAHATAAAVTAASPLASEAVARGASAVTDAAKASANSASPAIKAVVSRWPEAAGAATGAAVGHATGIPGAGYVGASIGREAGAALRGKLANVLAKTPADFVSELDATTENADYAGEKPPKPARWDAHDATKEFPPYAGGVDEVTAIPQRFAPPVGSAPAPVAVPAPARPVADAAPSVPVDPLLRRLQTIASQIKDDEAANPVTAKTRRPATSKVARVPDPGEDLRGLLQESLKQAQQRRAAAQQ